MKKLLYLIIIIAIAAGAYYFGVNQKKAAVPADTQKASGTATRPAPKNIPPFDPKNATYHDIDDMTVTLVDGQADTSVAPGSASTMTTEYFGHGATGDLNGDGLADTAFILTQYGAGTGIFYYAVAALRVGDSYKTTNAVFIGDRIAPNSTEIKNSEAFVHYKDRKSGQALAEEPTVDATVRFKINSKGELEMIYTL